MKLFVVYQRKQSLRRCESDILYVIAAFKGEHSPGHRVPSMGNYPVYNIRSYIADQEDVSPTSIPLY
jgi:hypothetical protein